jgi:hypothetical protein
VRYFCVTLQQSLLSAQHFCPDWQQAGFAPDEQQADFAWQQASLAEQQSASWTVPFVVACATVAFVVACATVAFPAVFPAQQQQVFSAAGAAAAEPFALAGWADLQHDLPAAQHDCPFWQQSALAP